MKDSIQNLFVGLIFMTGGGILLYNSSFTQERQTHHQLLGLHNTTHTIPEIMSIYRSGMIGKHVGEMKYILYWSKAYGSDAWYGLGSDPFKDCQVKDCYLTSNKSQVPVDKFDGILFHLRDFSFHDMPSKRNESQRYIMWTIESPAHTRYDKTNMKLLRGVFNWTYTYRADSDIVVPYGWSEPLAPLPEAINTKEFRRKQMLADGTNSATGKKRLVAWFVSNCGVANERDKYVRILQRYVRVDIYGKCGTRDCGNTAECDEMLGKTYKFYLSFENSNCEDYITEKFYRALKAGTIPIVYGGADYSKVAPPHSYIDIRKYKTARDLAEYIKLLDANDELYNEYFWWKKLYKIHSDWRSSNVTLCGLCARLHLDKVPKTYKSILKWWGIGSNCTIPSISPFPLWKERK